MKALQRLNTIYFLILILILILILPSPGGRRTR